MLTAVHNNLDPICVSDSVETEILVIEATVSNSKVRFINAYGNQESAKEEERKEFFASVDLEIKSAVVAGAVVCIELDANAKVGREEISNDPNEQSPNGKLLMEIVNNNGLIVVNTTDICEGVVTRKRKVQERTEESIIDYFIVGVKILNTTG